MGGARLYWTAPLSVWFGLTSFGEDDVLFRAMETGVSAFVPKTTPEQEIIAAVRHAAVAALSSPAPGSSPWGTDLTQKG